MFGCELFVVFVLKMPFKVPIEWAEKSVQAMKGMGFTSVNFKRFGGMGHESHPEVKLTFLIIFVSLLSYCFT